MKIKVVAGSPFDPTFVCPTCGAELLTGAVCRTAGDTPNCNVYCQTCDVLWVVAADVTDSAFDELR